MLDDEFCTLGRSPNGRVDLRRAWEQTEVDLWDGKLALDWGIAAARVFLNGWAWAEFWAARHPMREGRAKWAAIAEEYAAANARLVEKEEAMLRAKQ